MKVLVNGQLIEYQDEGRGRIVILLHGWGANLATFDGVAAHLTKKFRVIRLDFPGFGGSFKPTDNWGVGEYAQILGAFIAKLKLGDIYAAIGHSFGGRVIIKGIANGLLVPEKIVLIDAAGVKPAQSAKRSVFKVAAKVGKAVTAVPGLKQLRPMLRGKLYAAAGTTDYLDARDMQQIFLNTINEDLLPLVGAIKQPTLLIWGEKDAETPVRDAKAMLDKLPDARLVVVPDTGHFVYLDNPAVVMKELDSFL